MNEGYEPYSREAFEQAEADIDSASGKIRSENATTDELKQAVDQRDKSEKRRESLLEKAHMEANCKNSEYEARKEDCEGESVLGLILGIVGERKIVSSNLQYIEMVDGKMKNMVSPSSSLDEISEHIKNLTLDELAITQTRLQIRFDNKGHFSGRGAHNMIPVHPELRVSFDIEEHYGESSAITGRPERYNKIDIEYPQIGWGLRKKEE